MIVPHPSNLVVFSFVHQILVYPKMNDPLRKPDSQETIEMEQKSVLFSALGVGVGLGLGLASGQGLGKWANGSVSGEDGITGEKIEQELLRQIVDGRESGVTFDEFPYFLSEKTRHLLTSAAYVHLKQFDISKHTRNLAPASKAILLSGPAEFYQQMLAKALAHYFESKLSLLDVTDFSVKIQSKYGCIKKEPSHKRSISELTLEKMSNLVGSFSMLSQREETRGTLRRHTSGNDLTSRYIVFVISEVPPEPDNEFEKRIRPEVIPANEIGVTFADIGSLDETKESLQELVMLPLRRPDLFRGGLLKPCRGILLFGPHGTGKTMMAKAIAKEGGASFINVSMSTITSKWFGEDEKNVRALFTLAAKVSPTIIFVDEVGQRTRVGEHEAMRKIKNEFMTHWDGLMSSSGDRILVLAATNRPFDLDEAIIRRFERRIMVGLPPVESREKILRTLL
ncbi:hypothetical protein Bca101_053533 [Brassica carinata]